MLTIIDEPVDDAYQALLGFASRTGSCFSLVWREQAKFGASAHEIARLLESDLFAEARTDEWPGTRLIGHMATVRTYGLSANALTVLKGARGLYDWHEPSRPEDLAFYTSDGRVWLGSIAHERNGFVCAAAIDVPELMAHVRGLKLDEES
jgi:hypothetical protein